MPASPLPSLARSVAAAATAAILTACADAAPLAPESASATVPRYAAAAAESNRALATLRRATARYHDLDAAIADGFVFLSGCESRDEGPVGVMYVHMGRLMDGAIDPALPDALIYSPRDDGTLRLAAAELAVPYPLWAGAQPPRFLDAAFQREDEFGVYGLHVWLWLSNPEGLFAETNPRLSCAAE